MIVREPSERATLKEIIDHPWMREGGGAKRRPIVQTPLARSQSLNSEDQQRIIQRMVDGNIATKEEIQR